MTNHLVRYRKELEEFIESNKRWIAIEEESIRLYALWTKNSKQNIVNRNKQNNEIRERITEITRQEELYAKGLCIKCGSGLIVNLMCLQCGEFQPVEEE
jgi:hypothetical protein